MNRLLKLTHLIAVLFVPSVYWCTALDPYGTLLCIPAVLVAGRRFVFASAAAVSAYAVFVLISGDAAPSGPEVRPAETAYLTAQLALSCVFAARGRLVDRKPWVRADTGSPRRYTPPVRAFLLTCATLLVIALPHPDVPFLKTLCWAITFALLAKALPRRKKPKTTWRTALANVALVVISVAVSLALLEWGVRVFVDDPAEQPGDFVEYHPKSIWILKPNATRRLKLDAAPGQVADFTVTVSSQGFRDRFFEAKQPNEFRILFLGDSYTLGPGLTPDQTIPKALEARLRSQRLSKTVSVVNAGTGGFGPWQEHVTLQERGFPLDPDLVIFQAYVNNDIRDSLVKESRTLRAYHAQFQGRVRQRVFHGLWQVRLNAWLDTHWRTYHQITNMLEQPLLIAYWLRVPEKETLSLPRNEDRPFWLEVNLRNWYPELEEAWRICQEDILAIQADCHQRGIDFIACNIPARYEVRYWAWEGLQKTYDLAPYDRTKSARLAEEFFEEAGLPHVELLDLFLRYSGREELYFREDGHLSPAGAAFVAHQLRAYLMDVYFPAKGLLREEQEPDGHSVP